MQISIGLKNVDPARFRLPPHLEGRVMTALRARRLGLGMDYDMTAVRTDEKNRIFPPFIEDKSRVIEPTCGFLKLGVPFGVFSGNKPSYLELLCVRGLRTYLQQKGWIEALINMSVYAQNSTWLQVFGREGEPLPEVSRKYAQPYLIPGQHIEQMEKAFIGPLREVMLPTFMQEKPLIIRPEGTSEAHKVYGPIFEDRSGVSASWIAVPGHLRREVIGAALGQLAESVRRAYRFEPGGQFSIDINHLEVAKHNGTMHFRQEHGLSLLLYFGDSVYRQEDHIGNDLPVVNDPGAIVFAVNQNQEEVPQHERIVKAGIGPDATRAWFSWLLVTSVKARFEAEHLPDAEKTMMVDVLIKSGLGENIEIS
jgi:hypothetical protein